MRSSMAALTYGKLYDMRAMQPPRAANRRRCPGTTPAHIAGAMKSMQVELSRLTDAEVVARLRELADELERCRGGGR